jgi:hypothetical protein
VRVSERNTSTFADHWQDDVSSAERSARPSSVSLSARPSRVIKREASEHEQASVGEKVAHKNDDERPGHLRARRSSWRGSESVLNTVF